MNVRGTYNNKVPVGTQKRAKGKGRMDTRSEMHARSRETASEEDLLLYR